MGVFLVNRPTRCYSYLDFCVDHSRYKEIKYCAMLVYFSLFMGFFSCNSFNTIAMAAVEIDIYRLLLEFSSLFLGISLVTIRGLRVSRIKIVLREIINMVTCFFLLPPLRSQAFVIYLWPMHNKDTPKI